MTWEEYGAVVRRRWWILASIIAIAVLVSGYLYRRDTRNLGYQACSTLYVADVSSPSLVSAPPTTLAAEGQLLAGETAANFFGDDIVDIAQSQHVAAFAARQLQGRHLPSTSLADVNGSISGSRRDRTLSLCANNPNPTSATAVAAEVASAMTVHRSLFVGRNMARRTYVGVVSNPAVAPVSAGHARTNLLLRIVLGIVLAGALALLVEALDPRVVSRAQVEAALTVPVVAV